MSTPTIAIVGGSYAGTELAKKIDSLLKTKANIVLIEEREALYANTAALRSLTEPGFAEHVWVPYTSLLQNNPQSKVVQARAVEVSEKEVKLSNGESVAFDYLVFATGSNVPSPGKTQKLTKAEGVKEANEIYEALKSASSIVIVGGGTVGVELAGEIATDLPGKKVTLIHGGATLLNRDKPTPSTVKQVNQQLAKLNVDVKLNQRIVSDSGEPILPGGNLHIGKLSLKTSSGESIESDVQFLATGIVKPNSELAKSLGDVLDSTGYIQTEKTGQVKGFKNIFAVGDVSTLDTLKLAYAAGLHAVLVSANIAALIQNPSAALKQYTPVVAGGLIVASIGRNGGVLQSPLGTFGAWTTKNIKSKHLFLPKKWTDLNLKSTYTPPK
ncbi:UNVERIFIED_CONTAM: hypothetical protein HDU68_012495 [Siphonaria sp. JEL0065]|nr:hypothetical protein HDU68_012495 [Siphonaria sp. JEL0065]